MDVLANCFTQINLNSYELLKAHLKSPKLGLFDFSNPSMRYFHLNGFVSKWFQPIRITIPIKKHSNSLSLFFSSKILKFSKLVSSFHLPQREGCHGQSFKNPRMGINFMQAPNLFQPSPNHLDLVLGQQR